MYTCVHECVWCGEMTDSRYWACARCHPLKEEGYRRAREAEAQTKEEVLAYVHEVLKEHGVCRSSD